MAVSKEVLGKIRKQRNADLCDALDSMGYQDKYEMDVEMRPLFDGIRFAGYAHTHEYMRVPEHMPAMSYEDFDRLQYTPRAEGGYHFCDAASKPGPDEVLVIDAKRARGGVLGSDNTLAMQVAGCVGFVIDGTLRDSPECLRQKTPCFCTVRSYTHPQGRITHKCNNQPVHCGGVYVRPGDIISADDDGVLVIPQEIAEEVADRAYKIQQKDRLNRRRSFEQLGLPLDETVELLP